MNQKALRYEDFTVGELVEGRIESVAPSGITVSLGQNLKGTADLSSPMVFL